MSWNLKEREIISGWKNPESLPIGDSCPFLLSLLIGILLWKRKKKSVEANTEVKKGEKISMYKETFNEIKYLLPKLSSKKVNWLGLW